jgi:hypothetical protein
MSQGFDMLHITNGESVVHSFIAGSIPGSYLAWSDPLHDGPVPHASSLDEFSDRRAEALSSNGWGSYSEIRSAFAARDQAIAGFQSHEEVVLWFEHDLYDQLQLIQLLDWFSGQDLTGVGLSLIQINTHPDVEPFHGLGQLNGQQLAALLPARKPVSARQLALGRETWQAFCAPDPEALVRLAARDFPEMPFLQAALARFLEEYPSVESGLSRMQRQILLASASHSLRGPELYQVSQQFEQCPWGDTSVYLRLETLASGPQPALDREAENRFVINQYGKRLLAGEADWIRSRNGLDVWLGGVHLTGEDARWRWSAAEQSLRRTE